MRNLTIKRIKSFVGCAVKMKIYIEDPMSNELVINNVSCRKIGDLKSGEEKTFQIEEQAAKVFVIADKLSKNYCYEYYQLPEGEEDIYLTGKNHFNPANGNAFRFENNDNEEVLANRKRSTKKGIIIIIAGLIIGAIVGYVITSGLLSNKQTVDNKVKDKTFSSKGITITLTDEFIEIPNEQNTVCFNSRNVTIYTLQESFLEYEEFGAYTLEEYAEILIKANGFSDAEIKKDGGKVYFESKTKNSITQKDIRNIFYVYKTSDSFWFVQFSLLDEKTDEFRKQIGEWASTVKFDN